MNCAAMPCSAQQLGCGVWVGSALRVSARYLRSLDSGKLAV